MSTTVIVPFQEWNFHLLIGECDLEGLRLGTAEVYRNGDMCFTFSLAGNGARAAVQDLLQQECIAWVTEQEDDLSAASATRTPVS